MRPRHIQFLAYGLCLLLSGPLAGADDSTKNSPPTLTDDARSSALPLPDLQRFATAVNEIKQYYVEPVNDDKLFENAIRGMLEGLDPHSSYLDAEDFRDLQDATNGEFTGLGIEIMEDHGYIRVISPIDDTPAQKGGIKPGDLIIRIDGIAVKGMELRDAVSKMRGKPGTSVTLTIVRKDSETPIKIKLTRERVVVKSIKSVMIAKGYGYIRISTFQANSTADLVHAIEDLKKQSGGQLKGVVIDLRNDPGGLLEAAVDITDLFLDSDKLGHDKLIVYTKGRLPNSQFIARADSSDILHGAPIVILINAGSASGSEIVAGALQDQKRAVIMGTTSFGKGSVQTVLPLDDNTALKLTTALYYTPSGRSIQAKGIHPDVYVPEIAWPPANKNSQDGDLLKEADLMGHLHNGNGSADGKDDQQGDDSSNSKNTSDLPSPHTDYQLNQALNLLRGLNVLHN